MGNKRNWEKEYEKYSDLTELETEISELNKKYENQTMTKEEFKQWEKSKALKENLPKVKNIIELREKLSAENKQIKEELESRKNLVMINKENEKLENELIALEAIRIDLEEKMKDKNLSEEQKNDLNKEYALNEAKISKNNELYGQTQEKLAQSSGMIKNSKISNEELEEKSINIQTKISKCNLACNKLMKGFSWKSIDLALESFKDAKFTANKQQTQKIKKVKEALQIPKTGKQQKGLIVSEKTSFLNKVKGFFSKVADKAKSLKEKFIKKKDNLSDLEEEVTEEIPKEDDFRKYLKEVAEKGLSGIEEENIQQAATTALDKKIELYEKRYNELSTRDDVDKVTIEKLALAIEELKAQRDGKDGAR